MAGVKMRTIFLMFLSVITVIADMNDVDTTTNSDTSSTGGVDGDMDNNDPNLHNPLPRQGYGAETENPSRWDVNRKDQEEEKPQDEQKENTGEDTSGQAQSTEKPRVKLTLGQQSLNALLEFGIIVGVAIMVGGMFMAMVGAEILYDKLVEKYREVFKKPKPLSDIERLHPAALVGTFSRYK